MSFDLIQPSTNFSLVDPFISGFCTPVEYTVIALAVINVIAAYATVIFFTGPCAFAPHSAPCHAAALEITHDGYLDESTVFGIELLVSVPFLIVEPALLYGSWNREESAINTWWWIRLVVTILDELGSIGKGYPLNFSLLWNAMQLYMVDLYSGCLKEMSYPHHGPFDVPSSPVMVRPPRYPTLGFGYSYRKLFDTIMMSDHHKLE